MVRSRQYILSDKIKSGIRIILNRPKTINSLTESMLDQIRDVLEQALNDNNCRFVLFCSTTPKGFCAGGDVKELARLGMIKEFSKIDSFFNKEYSLDLKIHQFPKPVIVIADGITMGGGLGITAGADISIATDKTRMAMPEARIGFFPDVGSTGWMFSRCPKGYPEYLGLTGYHMNGMECVRLGFATHFMKSGSLTMLMEILEHVEIGNDVDKQIIKRKLLDKITHLMDGRIADKHDLDSWVEKFFAGKSDIREIMTSLSRCEEQEVHCSKVFKSIGERSPTALVLTLKLLRLNEGRPLEDVFKNELKAARFITRHPDYIEGVRARLFDRDDRPKWKPDRIDLVDLSEFKL